MNRVITLVGVGITSAAMVLSAASPAFAWHPEGEIVKEVQNVTQGGQLADANSAEDAVMAHPGDTLKYVITVRNDGDHHSKGWNDMHFTEVKDQLPAGVELLEGDTDKDLGVIEAGKSKQYAFTVKVTANEDSSVICNTAQFTGDSEINDQPQSGQDDACVEVDVPPVPEEPQTPVTPQEPEAPTPETPLGKGEAPKELPSTGPGAFIGGLLGVSSLGYLGHVYLRSRFVK